MIWDSSNQQICIRGSGCQTNSDYNVLTGKLCYSNKDRSLVTESLYEEYSCLTHFGQIVKSVLGLCCFECHVDQLQMFIDLALDFINATDLLIVINCPTNLEDKICLALIQCPLCPLRMFQEYRTGIVIQQHSAFEPHPESKVHGANMGPTWVLSAPDGPHVGPMNLAISRIEAASGWHHPGSNPLRPRGSCKWPSLEIFMCVCV